MSDQSSKFTENVKDLLEDLDPSDKVKVDDDSYAVIAFDDGSSSRIESEDCQRLFQTTETVEKLCLLTTAATSTLSIFGMTLPDDVVFELETRFCLFEEL